MKILIIGGSSFIGKNLIERIPSNCDVSASYNSSKSFLRFVKNYPNVKPFKLDLLKNKKISLGDPDIILYLVGISPANDRGQMVENLNIMDYLHSKAISYILKNTKKVNKFIYFSSGIYYLLDNYSNYRKSRLLGESSILLESKLLSFDYVIIRNMEIYGKYMAKHKIYRRLCEFALNNVREISINGDGTNLIETMYIDDYIDIIIKILKSNLKNKIIDISKSKPVTIKNLIKIIYNVCGNDQPKINFSSTATENTNFILDNTEMIRSLDFNPTITLNEGLLKWIKGGLK